MDTSDTADITAMYVDAGGEYRNGSHDIDIPSGRAPACVVTHPTLDRLVRARVKCVMRGGLVDVVCARGLALSLADGTGHVQRLYVSVQ